MKIKLIILFLNKIWGLPFLERSFLSSKIPSLSLKKRPNLGTKHEAPKVDNFLGTKTRKTKYYFTVNTFS